MVNGFWFKRIIKYQIIDISRDDISYLDWYKIFHYKDYSMLIKYENILINKLLKLKKENILKIYINKIYLIVIIEIL